jgi:hypothetical protein
MSDEFFPVCKGKTVLEIGPMDGWFTKEILVHEPKQLTLLEASFDVCNLLKKYFLNANVKIINGDMHKDLSLIGKVDVAILLGVIYHSHAPLYIFEELVNICNPEIIIIDNPGNFFNWGVEKTNYPGMRYTIGNTKTCNIVITIDEKILISALENLGYKLETKNTYPNNDVIKTGNIPVYQFRKQ